MIHVWIILAYLGDTDAMRHLNHTSQCVIIWVVLVVLSHFSHKSTCTIKVIQLYVWTILNIISQFGNQFFGNSRCFTHYDHLTIYINGQGYFLSSESYELS